MRPPLSRALLLTMCVAQVSLGQDTAQIAAIKRLHATNRMAEESKLAASPPAANVTGPVTRLFLTGSNADAVASFSSGAEFIRGDRWTVSSVLGGKIPIQKGAEDATFATDERLADGAEFSFTLHHLHWDQDADNTQPFFIDIVGKTARATRQFLNSTTFLPDSLDATAWSVGVDAARFFSMKVIPAGLFAVGYSYGRSFKAQKEGQGCVLVGTTTIQCRTAPIGAPKKKEGYTIHSEVRGFISPRLAINPTFQYKHVGHVKTYAMPIYFAPDAKGGLIGGVEPGWDSEDRRFGFRIFIGTTAFGLGDAQ